MTMSLPPNYVPLPIEVIEQAYRPDKPHRALFASFVRLLALAWQNKYERTSKLREEDLFNSIRPDGTTQFGYLKLSRREYFTQKREMELLGWLRSTRPAAGFVQFIFSRPVSGSQAAQVAGAENRTEVQKTAPDDLKRIEEEELNNFKNQESSSSILIEQPVQKTALTAAEQQMHLLVEHLRLVFDPEDYGLLEWREIFLCGIPERVLGWIAKAYQDRIRLESPIGLIVKHIALQDAPDRYFMEHYLEILPESFLEAVGLIEYSCDYCPQAYGRRADLETHIANDHHVCLECGQAFDSAELEHTHYQARHDPYRAHEPGPDPLSAHQADPSVTRPIDGRLTAEDAWQSVLSQLQTEMPRSSFETWVRDTKVCRYDSNALEISTRNAYARDWLENRLQSTVERLLVGILNQSVHVVFVETDAA